MSGIFKSHASADKALVDPFVESVIQLGCEIPKESIFYSSGEDTGIPSGFDLNGYVRSRMEQVSLVIAIISPTFQTRPFCIAELGAAWSQVGKLFPIAVPGLPHADMQGVLSGLTVRYLSDSSALDELHDLICDLFDVNPGAKTWGRHKNRWLAGVEDYVRQLPTPRVITPNEFDRVTADLEGSRDALREAEARIREQAVQISRLAALKPAKEVTEILLPADDRERFDALVKQASSALSKLPNVVRDAIWYDLNYREMPWPESRSSDFDEAFDAGWLLERSEVGVRPNQDFDEVRNATDTVHRLSEFFDSRIGDAFDVWYRDEYHTPPDLSLKRVWDELF
jgi:hypothetical protein